MDSEKKLPKARITPVKKSKVFQQEVEDDSTSPLWVPPLFKSRAETSHNDGSRIFKSKKPSFVSKVSGNLDPSQIIPPEVEIHKADIATTPVSNSQKTQGFKLPVLSVFFLILASILAACLIAWVSYHQGFLAAENHLNQLRLELPAEIPREFENAINSAFVSYSEGKASEATAALEVVYRKNQTIPSTCYLLALMAIQSGDLKLALQKVDESIAKGEKVSDALALKAAIEMENGGRGGMSDPRVAAESLLRTAMAADISNPRPYIELASLLRFQGRNDEARKLFEDASLRLNPVEGHALVDTSLALLELQQTPDSKLPTGLNPDKDSPSLMSAAYVAMRKNDLPIVKVLLAKARERLSGPLYNYLINDPAIKTFSKNPDFSGLF